MKELWFGGFFGKGIYSRSSPQFQIGKNSKNYNKRCINRMVVENETLWLNIEELIILNYNLGILKLFINPTTKVKSKSL